jgi:acyl-CoA synthetase (AMP-forming)/AMP-acid ligase II
MAPAAPTPRALLPPEILFEGRRWTPDELAAVAAAWHGELAARVAPEALVATALPTHPEAVALYFALSARPGPFAPLARVPSGWRSDPPLPPGTALVLPPAHRHLAPEAERRGLRPVLLGETAAAARAAARTDLPFLGAPVVSFTSGSTGAPKPVVRPGPGLLATARARAERCGLARGARLLNCLPLDRGIGLTVSALLASVVEGRVVLLRDFDHRAVLAHLAAGPVDYWVGMPVMAQALLRAAAPPVPRGPRACFVMAWLSRDVFDGFRRTFGVPLRGAYGSTECGGVAEDGAPADAVRWGTVGPPLRGVEVRIGDHPADPWPPGRAGPIWVRGPGVMAGYGFPPAVTPVRLVDGWYRTGDLGRLEPDGVLALAGRADDCVRTAAGYLVNLAEIAQAALGHPGVREAVAVALGDAEGLHVGLLVEADGAADPAALRRRLAGALPPWCQPRALAATPALPRLPGGKPDRRAAAALLRDRGGRAGAP